MRQHGFKQVQEVWQRLALHLISASHEEQARILKADASGFVVTPKLMRQFEKDSRIELRKNPGDEIVFPSG